MQGSRILEYKIKTFFIFYFFFFQEQKHGGKGGPNPPLWAPVLNFLNKRLDRLVRLNPTRDEDTVVFRPLRSDDRVFETDGSRSAHAWS